MSPIRDRNGVPLQAGQKVDVLVRIAGQGGEAEVVDVIVSGQVPCVGIRWPSGRYDIVNAVNVRVRRSR